jgi:sulfide:quinone oxidoreductase
MGQASRPGSYGGLRVLIAGGGVAGLEAMLALHELAGDLVDVELLAPDLHFWYRPLAVAEPFGRSQAYHFELPVVAGEVGASFTPGALTAVEPDRHVAHTSRGAELEYDVLVVACGARATPALEGALTFRGPSDTERVQALLGELEAGAVRRLVFACPPSAGWSLPLYELALLTAAHLEEREIAGVELTLVTPEPAALARLGAGASEAVELLLAEHDVTLVTDSRPVSFAARHLELAGRRGVKADRVVALPRLQGLRVTGLPHDRDGFVATAADGLAGGLLEVYAAGDITRFPVKQGGIAAQQADVVAETIAALAGADVERSAFEPVIHALLLSGGEPLYIRAELAGDDPQCTVSTEPLWWPPSKVAGRYLSPFLASRVSVESNARDSLLER